jgi:hypothetical protein
LWHSLNKLTNCGKNLVLYRPALYFFPCFVLPGLDPTAVAAVFLFSVTVFVLIATMVAAAQVARRCDDFRQTIFVRAQVRYSCRSSFTV